MRRFNKCKLNITVAVFDTGLDKSHPDIKGHLKSIWVYDDSQAIFSKAEQSDIADAMGHGTHIVGLILTYIPHLTLYVANVAPKGKADRDLLARVNENHNITARLTYHNRLSNVLLTTRLTIEK